MANTCYTNPFSLLLISCRGRSLLAWLNLLLGVSGERWVIILANSGLPVLIAKLPFYSTVSIGPSGLEYQSWKRSNLTELPGSRLSRNSLMNETRINVVPFPTWVELTREALYCCPFSCVHSHEVRKAMTNYLLPSSSVTKISQRSLSVIGIMAEYVPLQCL